MNASQLKLFIKYFLVKTPMSDYSRKYAFVKRLFLLIELFFIGVSYYFAYKTGTADKLIYIVAAVILGISFLLSTLFDSYYHRPDFSSTLFCIMLPIITAYMFYMHIGGTGLLILSALSPVILILFCDFQSGTFSSMAVLAVMALFMFTRLGSAAGTAYSLDDRTYMLISGIFVFITIFLIGLHKHKESAMMQRKSDRRNRSQYADFMSSMTQMILSISNALDARDKYVQRHSARVAEYSVMLGRKLGLSDIELEELKQIALLHDIGKIGVSDVVLNKHSRLTDEEYELIKNHTVIGGDILKDLAILPKASFGAIYHHERFDGTGYPYQLKGYQIPFEARIISIADSFDAMNSSRVYRKRMNEEIIMRELENGKGTQFDPDMLELFLPIAREVMAGQTEELAEMIDE